MQNASPFSPWYKIPFITLIIFSAGILSIDASNAAAIIFLIWSIFSCAILIWHQDFAHNHVHAADIPSSNKSTPGQILGQLQRHRNHAAHKAKAAISSRFILWAVIFLLLSTAAAYLDGAQRPLTFIIYALALSLVTILSALTAQMIALQHQSNITVFAACLFAAIIWALLNADIALTGPSITSIPLLIPAYFCFRALRKKRKTKQKRYAATGLALSIILLTVPACWPLWSALWLCALRSSSRKEKSYRLYQQ